MSRRPDLRAEPPAVHDETSLLAAARRGDRDAFDQLAVRLLPRLLGTAQRLLGNAVEAEETVAATLARVFAGLGGFRGASALSTWAHRILCRLAADRLRQLKRQRARESALPDDVGAEASGTEPRQAAIQREEGLRLRSLVERLPTMQRLVLVLVAWEGLSLAETASLLEMRYATAKSNLHHARLALRAALIRLEGEA